MRTIANQERMLVAAALQVLREERDIEASASVVIGNRHWLPNLSGRVELNQTRSGGGFTGVSPGHGNVKVDDGEPVSTTRSIGGEPERIGQFRIWRDKGNRIKFAHYWGFDLATQSEDNPPIEYVIDYADDETLVRFGVLDIQRRRSLWKFHVITSTFRLVFGDPPLVPICTRQLEVRF